MGYIITADVSLGTENNMCGKIDKVRARILYQTAHTITFDIRGDFDRQAALTLELCKTLVEAGFISFAISHSY